MKSIVRTFLLILCQAIILLSWNQAYSGERRDGPVILIDQTMHSFSAVFEGEELTHAFDVFNRGTADLNIRKVSHS